MVGHVLRFHPAYEALLQLVRQRVIGEPITLDARRLTGSRSPSALWALAPHDLATLHAIDPSDVVDLAARPAAPRPSLAADAVGARAVELELRLRSGLSAHLLLSTAAAAPARGLVLTGSRRRVVVDELGGDRFLWHEATDANETDAAASAPTERLPLPEREPLLAELEHFVHCVQRRSAPRCSLEEGAWVVEIIEHAQRLLGLPTPTIAARPRAWAVQSPRESGWPEFPCDAVAAGGDL